MAWAARSNSTTGVRPQPVSQDQRPAIQAQNNWWQSLSRRHSQPPNRQDRPDAAGPPWNPQPVAELDHRHPPGSACSPPHPGQLVIPVCGPSGAPRRSPQPSRVSSIRQEGGDAKARSQKEMGITVATADWEIARREPHRGATPRTAKPRNHHVTDGRRVLLDRLPANPYDGHRRDTAFGSLPESANSHGEGPSNLQNKPISSRAGLALRSAATHGPSTTTAGSSQSVSDTGFR